MDVTHNAFLLFLFMAVFKGIPRMLDKYLFPFSIPLLKSWENEPIFFFAQTPGTVDVRYAMGFTYFSCGLLSERL